jgi:protein-tyrosine phosphatase
MSRAGSGVFGSGPDGQTYTVEGTYNVRDVGGPKTISGARIRTGRLLRSASLDSLTPAGIETVRTFGLRTVIDLRSRTEVDRHGYFPTDDVAVRWEHLPSAVGPPTTGESNQADRIQQHPDPMAPMYQEILEHNGPEIARGLRILSSPANLPAIAHCTSGKDRTGLFVVILHLVLGVSLDDALDHYHQDDATTQRAMAHMLSRFPEMAEMPPGKMARMAGTNSRWVTGALSSIGGEEAVPDWLRANGCDAHSQAQLRAAFLD